MLDTNIADVMAIIAMRSEAANPRNDKDYVMPDGLLYCGNCHTAKQCRPFPDNPDCIVYCLCDCEIAKQKETENHMKEMDIERARRICFQQLGGAESKNITDTFDADDSPETKPSQIARKYAKKFEPKGKWLLFCGANGIGKSFYAGCICNAVIDAGYTARFTSISEIESARNSAYDKTKVFDELSRYDLLVIDDFGAERDTPYMREIQFNVLDNRLRLGKPCIITTNLSSEQIWKPADQSLARIFSRIIENSYLFTCTGTDRRKQKIIDENADAIRRLLDD